jgi:hypothetical protein
MTSVSTPDSGASTRLAYVAEIFLMSFVGLLLEACYTRIISFAYLPSLGRECR